MRWRVSDNEEKEALSDIRAIVIDRLKNITAAEIKRVNRKLQSKAREGFMINPFGFTSRLLGKARSGTWVTTKKEVEEYLANVHNDSHRNEDLGEMENLYEPAQPTSELEGHYKCTLSEWDGGCYS
jgi:hypothetical protein